jgi:type I restriction enzyme S subunit
MRRVPLGDVLDLALDEVEVEGSTTYPIAGVYSFGRGVFPREPITGTETSYRHLNRLHSRRFVMSRLKAFEGAVAVVSEDLDGYFVSQEFPTFTFDEQSVVPEYFGFLCRWPEFWALLSSASKGVGARRERVHPEQLFAVAIPLPDLAEQRRIVARLERLLEASRKLDEAQARTSREVLLPLFPLITDRVLSEAAYEHRRIGDLVDVVPEVMKPGELPGSAQAFVGLQHVESHTGRKTGSLPLGSEKGDKRRFRAGDIVYGNLRPYLNKVWFTDFDGVCSVDQRVLRPRPGVDGELLAYAIRSRSLLDQAIARTAALQLPRVRMRDFLEFEVPVVNLVDAEPVRERLTRTLGWALHLLDLRASQKKRAAALRVSVLNRAFTDLL